MVSAYMHGLIIMALSLPEVAAHRAAARPFGAATADEWSLAALGIAAIASAFLEPTQRSSGTTSGSAMS